MPDTTKRIDHRNELNRASPALAHAKVGDVLYDLIETTNRQGAALRAMKTAIGAGAAAVVIPSDVKTPEERQ